MADTSKRILSKSACLSSSILIYPLLLVDLDVIALTPLTLANADSRRDVTSASTVRGDAPYIEKLTVIDGRAAEGISLTGSRGIRAHPAKAMAINTIMMLKELSFNFLEIIVLLILRNQSVCKAMLYQGD